MFPRQLKEHILGHFQFLPHFLGGQFGEIGVAPGVVAQFKFWVGGDQPCFIGMGAHPIATHEKSGRDIVAFKTSTMTAS